MPECRGPGIGRELVYVILDLAVTLEYHEMIAAFIASGNRAD